MSDPNLDKPGYDGMYSGGQALAKYFAASSVMVGHYDQEAFDHCVGRLSRAKHDPEDPEGGLRFIAGFFSELADWRIDLLIPFIPPEEDGSDQPVPDFMK